MSTLRIILGVVVGYLVFAVGSMLLVRPVMSATGPWVAVMGLVGLTLIGLAAGFVAPAIAKPQPRLAVYILAGLVAVATLANLLLGFGAEPTWYKAGTLLLTVSAILWAGLRRP